MWRPRLWPTYCHLLKSVFVSINVKILPSKVRAEVCNYKCKEWSGGEDFPPGYWKRGSLLSCTVLFYSGNLRGSYKPKQIRNG